MPKIFTRGGNEDLTNALQAGAQTLALGMQQQEQRRREANRMALAEKGFELDQQRIAQTDERLALARQGQEFQQGLAQNADARADAGLGMQRERLDMAQDQAAMNQEQEAAARAYYTDKIMQNMELMGLGGGSAPGIQTGAGITAEQRERFASMPVNELKGIADLAEYERQLDHARDGLSGLAETVISTVGIEPDDPMMVSIQEMLQGGGQTMEGVQQARSTLTGMLAEHQTMVQKVQRRQMVSQQIAPLVQQVGSALPAQAGGALTAAFMLYQSGQTDAKDFGGDLVAAMRMMEEPGQTQGTDPIGAFNRSYASKLGTEAAVGFGLSEGDLDEKFGNATVARDRLGEFLGQNNAGGGGASPETGSAAAPAPMVSQVREQVGSDTFDKAAEYVGGAGSPDLRMDRAVNRAFKILEAAGDDVTDEAALALAEALIAANGS
jgi:hypothetical protein